MLQYIVISTRDNSPSRVFISALSWLPSYGRRDIARTGYNLEDTTLQDHRIVSVVATATWVTVAASVAKGSCRG
jgi:hypothetical protein